MENPGAMKTQQEIQEAVVKVLHETFGIDPERIVPGADLYADLDIDSIDAIDLLVKLQKMTGKRLQPEAFKSVRKIEDVVRVVHTLVNEA
jgi:acyl carrier protein